VDIVTLEDSEITPVAPKPLRKSPKGRKKKRRKRAVQRDEDGRLVIRLTEAGSAQTADAAEDEGRPNQTADNFGARTIHSAEEGAVLATDVATVQIMATPIQGAEEVRSTNGREPVEGQVDTQAEDHLPEANGQRKPVDTEWDTVPISPPSSPVSTAATVVAARQMSTTRPVREQKDEILALLGTVMKRIKAWSGRVEAETSEAVEADVTTWKKQLANCEEALRQKVASLTDAEKGQAELRKALATKEAELAAAQVEVVEQRRRCADTDHLQEELRVVEADVKSLKRRHGILRADIEEAR
jgi:hypothetical protein